MHRTGRGDLRGDKQTALVADAGDGPGVAVGDAEVAVVAAGGDPVADPDPLPGERGRDHIVVDVSGGDECAGDGGVECGDRLTGVGHDRRPVPLAVEVAASLASASCSLCRTGPRTGRRPAPTGTAVATRHHR
jgi:hypothetical protein